MCNRNEIFGQSVGQRSADTGLPYVSYRASVSASITTSCRGSLLQRPCCFAHREVEVRLTPRTGEVFYERRADRRAFALQRQSPPYHHRGHMPSSHRRMPTGPSSAFAAKRVANKIPNMIGNGR
jgi:hypothetical protein